MPKENTIIGNVDISSKIPHAHSNRPIQTPSANTADPAVAARLEKVEKKLGDYELLELAGVQNTTDVAALQNRVDALEKSLLTLQVQLGGITKP